MDELVEVTENLGAVRKYLKENAVQLMNSVGKRKDGRSLGSNQIQEPGSITQISEWLNQQGEVMSKSKIP